eukprot:362930-Chlamydomonas_euryale.AAC.11
MQKVVQVPRLCCGRRHHLQAGRQAGNVQSSNWLAMCNPATGWQCAIQQLAGNVQSSNWLAMCIPATGWQCAIQQQAGNVQSSNRVSSAHLPALHREAGVLRRGDGVLKPCEVCEVREGSKARQGAPGGLVRQ